MPVFPSSPRCRALAIPSLLLDGGNFGEDGDPFGFHFVAQPEDSYCTQERSRLEMLRAAHGDLRGAAPADAQYMLCSAERAPRIFSGGAGYARTAPAP